MIQLVVKLGYKAFWESRFHSRNHNLDTPRSGARYSCKKYPLKVTQVIDFTRDGTPTGVLFYTLKSALKCSKMQRKEGVGGGKIGVRPRFSFLNFKPDFLSGSFPILSKKHHLKTLKDHAEEIPVVLHFQHVSGGTNVIHTSTHSKDKGRASKAPRGISKGQHRPARSRQNR